MASERADISVRERLPKDLLWVLGTAGVVLTVSMARSHGVGWDAHAYWLAWQGGDVYGRPPGTEDAFLYSPVFALLTWPLAQLPWPVFGAVFIGAGAVGTAWLLAPMGARSAVPLWFAASLEYVSGNVFWWLAVAAVLAGRRPLAHTAWWAVSALTKITPCLGPFWHLVRGQWARLAVSVGAPMLLAVLAWLVAPDLWSQWLVFLLDNGNRSQGALGSPLAPPLLLRLPLALALVVWGARTDRLWTLPVGMFLATPVFGVAGAILLAAIPRLRAQARESAYLS